MIIGHDKLLELFPNFKEDIAENGIDLRIGKVEHTVNKQKRIGCIDGEKNLPKTYEVRAFDDVYKFYPHNYYTIVVDRPIRIPDGYCQFYFIRSTFARCGLVLTDAVGDNGFDGTLRLGIYNANNIPVYAGLNEAIIQAVTIRNDGTAKEYDGEYQEDKIYESVE